MREEVEKYRYRAIEEWRESEDGQGFFNSLVAECTTSHDRVDAVSFSASGCCNYSDGHAKHMRTEMHERKFRANEI